MNRLLPPTPHGRAGVESAPVVRMNGHDGRAAPAEAPLAAGWHPGWSPVVGPLLKAARPPLPDPGALRYRQALDALARQPGEPVALSLRMPFCAVRCLCCDRDIHAAQSEPVLDDDVAGLVREIHLLADRLGARREVLQLHLGGGSANVLTESHLAQLVHAVRQRWQLPADAEMSVECDPRRTGWGQLRLLRGLGFRQVSFGVLDLDPQVQRACGRLQSAALVDDVCNLARATGIEGINLELMVGLPHQAPDRWQATLRRVVSMAPDRLTLTRYRHRPERVPAQCAIDRDALPDAAQCEELTQIAADVLCSVGYRWIGADQFVLESDPLSQALDQGRLRRNLLGHTATPPHRHAATPPVPLLGLGAGAVGEIAGGIFWNEGSLAAWTAQWVGTAAPASSSHRPARAGVPLKGS